jgi:Poxvirus A32 protein
MRFIRQQQSLPIHNFDKNVNKKLQNKKHGSLLPNSIRCIIVGPSNCGKTNVLLSLLTHPNGLKFENIYIYSKSLNQPKYVFFKKILEPIKEIKYFTFSNNVDIITPNNARKNSIFIFDDVSCEKQNIIREYFSMGRHNKIDSFYLCQSYTRIPKHLIRDNANLLLIFKQDGLNLKHIYNDHINSDMSFEMFKNICKICWKENYGFLVIDKDSQIDKGRYRKGMDNFILL